MYYVYLKEEECKKIKIKTLLIKEIFIGCQLSINTQHLPLIHSTNVAAKNRPIYWLSNLVWIATGKAKN